MDRRGSQNSQKPSISLNDDISLTHKELLSIVKATAAWNGGKLEFNEKYLSYANELPMKVERKDGTLIVRVP